MTPSEPSAESGQRQEERRSNSDRRGIQTKTFNDKQYIFREHESGQEAFIVKEGQVEIFRVVTENDVPKEISLGILEAGTMFGEMALIDNKPRMASARAHNGAVTVMVVSQKQFNTMLEPVNPFVRKLLEILATHVRTASNKSDD